MKVKNLIIGIVVIIAIGVIVFFAMKMTKDIKNNDVNNMNAVEAESEEVVEDATNVIEEANTTENEVAEGNNETTENKVEENKAEENKVTETASDDEDCGCGCGADDSSCCTEETQDDC